MVTMTDSPTTGSFLVPDEIAFFNAAYMGPRLASVQAAGEAAMGRTARPWEVPASDFFEPVEKLRGEVAYALGGDSEGIALIPGVSYGASIAAANLPVAPDQTVVVLAEQFPSNVYPWMSAVERTGGEIVTVPRSNAGWTAGVLEAIDDRTAVVTIPNCHWTDGTVVDLGAVSAACKAVGAAMCLDLSQSFGAYPVDVAAIDPDLVFTTGYKWQLGFYGLGYLWVAPRHRSGTPLEQGWAVRKDAEDFAGLVDYTDVYEAGARRFDVAERSNFVGVAMGLAAMRQINDWGVQKIATTLRQVTDEIAGRAAESGWDTAPPSQRAGHILGLRRSGGLPGDALDRFGAAGVSVSVRGDSVRISPHLHIKDTDVDRLVDVLATF